MLYKIAELQPDVPLSYEQEKPTMLGFLANGCWLEDTLPENYIGDPNIVLPEHQPIFSSDENEKFAFPDPEHVNQLVKEGMVSVQLSTWKWNEFFGVRRNLRRFNITSKGQQYVAEYLRDHPDAHL